MSNPQIVPQVQFATIEDFIREQNNYYYHFLLNDPYGAIRRQRPHFIRFQNQHPEMESDLSSTVTEACTSTSPKRLPYEKLFESYKIMSQLVYESDPGVLSYSEPSKYLLS